MHWLILVVAAYILGSLPFGVIVAKTVRGIDLRQFGSGNIGAANAIRTLGPWWGGLVLLADVAKGSLAVGILPGLAGPFAPQLIPAAQVTGGLMAIIGHNYSVFLGGKGGKGIATSLGVLICLDWRAAVLGLALWGLMVVITHYSSVGSLVGALSIPVWMYATGKPLAYKLFALLAVFFAFYQHRGNLKRLIKGTEHRLF